ncbi:MAG: AAA family ATPase, partial [Candidatus Omnitrophica bacterium]|nr:AAA family ATPase [Candidatus Omnitrophota bacterium]
MKLKKIQLKNGYKRFHNLTIDLGSDPKKIIALVGPNGCGKSSVIDAMLFHSNAYGRIGKYNQKDYTYHSMNQ